MLEVVFSGMFGGKTTYLEKLYKKHRKREVVAVKSDLDTRYGTEPALITHDKKKIPAVLIPNDDPSQIWNVLTPEVKWLLIDEVMFFPPQALVEVVERVLARGVNVVAAGLDKTAELAPFGAMPQLLAIADTKTQLYARCDGCGGAATLSYTKVPKEQAIVVGNGNLYGAACVTCHPKLHKGPVAGV